MDLNFNKVDYDGELSEFSKEDLRKLVEKFETAQESNVAEFEKAAEATEDINENTIKDFQSARESLVEEIAKADTFDEVPLTEESLEEQSFTDLQEWKDFVASTEKDIEAADDSVEDDGDFDDFGTQSPKQDGDETESFVEEQLGQMQGLNL